MSKFLENLFKAAKTDANLAAKLKRAEEMGYDLSQVYYHGSPRSDIGKMGGNFIPSDKGGNMFGVGSYFASDPTYANEFAQSMHIDEINARNLADNPAFGATNNPPYNKEWGQTVYPVFLKKSEYNVDDSAHKTLKNNFIKVLSDKNDIKTAKQIEDNYNLINYVREKLDPQETSDLMQKSGINTAKLPHGNAMVINPEENVKSVFAEFKDKKGLMSAVAPVAGFGNYLNEKVDQNPVKTINNLYTDYKQKQEDVVKPAADYMARQLDLSNDPESGIKKAVRFGSTEALDPLNYIEGIPGAIMTLLNLSK